MYVVIVIAVITFLIFIIKSGGDKKEEENTSQKETPQVSENTYPENREALEVTAFSKNNEVHSCSRMTDTVNPMYSAHIYNKALDRKMIYLAEDLIKLRKKVESQFKEWLEEEKERERERQLKAEGKEILEELASEISGLTQKEILQSFVAIDCEIANDEQSICQIGLVVMENGIIVKEIDRLIQPPNNEYKAIYTRIHGITAKDTANAPTFIEVWDEIKGLFNNTAIVAHNGNSADFNYLKKELRRNGLTLPNTCGYKDSMRAFGKQKLEDLCLYYNIDIGNHHDALSDARACALLYNQRWEEGWVRPTAEDIKEAVLKNKEKKEEELKIASENADTSNFFHNKGVVFTGFSKSEGELVREELIKCGALIKSNVSSKVNILIKGDQPGPAKMKKLKEFQDKGFEITVFEKNEFYEKLNKQ